MRKISLVELLCSSEKVLKALREVGLFWKGLVFKTKFDWVGGKHGSEQNKIPK